MTNAQLIFILLFLVGQLSVLLWVVRGARKRAFRKQLLARAAR